MPTPTAPVLLHREGAIAHLRLNRPAQQNALDVATALAFAEGCLTLAEDASVRAVIVSGAGRSFGVGGDLAELRSDAPAKARALIEPMHMAVRTLAALNAPVIASLHGNVAGGSLSLAMACDLALAADDTRFNLAYVNVGASCDVAASWNLPRLVGLRNAMQIALLGERFDAHEALRLGLVNRVVAAAELESATQKLAERLANGPTLALGRLKRLLRQSFDHGLSTQLDHERDEFAASAATADFAEALDAFFAKRAPRFAGR